MMEEIDRFQVPSAVQEAEMQSEMQPLDPASSTASEAESDTREGEAVTINYKPSPLQMKIDKQRDLARKGSLKNNNTVGSPVNQQPKKNNVMARTRLVVPNKGYSSLDQSPDEKPLVALDTDSDDDFDMSRYSSSGYSSAEQINQDLNIQLLKDGYRLDEIPDDEDLDLIPPKSVNPTCMCCQATSSTTCQIQ
ncbi:protein FAM219A [Poecilia latipinna]|uniref:Family with sequence similarity 219 member Ab n=3 Tax=Poecilia TaxID=8080 RepID=A0A087XRC3_POEFO|nr:PREDICTED: protein FAM219A [Poecilia formosa]XP_014859547.1 PREDICTED: protein FAM219A [Poecilia mexicana]XP_014880453.1 PREDICTED: protein FAM219A [Poecilia latipinna]